MLSEGEFEGRFHCFTVSRFRFIRKRKGCNNVGITFSKATSMTMTVKLDAPLERALRRRSSDLGLPASVLMREALQSYLTMSQPAQPSAFALGQDLFGRQTGPKNLSQQRKAELARVWDQKRSTTPSHRGKV